MLLGAIRISPTRISSMSENPKLLNLLKTRLEEKQRELSENLEKVHWEIDSEATLLAVAGDGPIESVSSPCHGCVKPTI